MQFRKQIGGLTVTVSKECGGKRWEESVLGGAEWSKERSNLYTFHSQNPKNPNVQSIPLVPGSSFSPFIVRRDRPGILPCRNCHSFTHYLYYGQHGGIHLRDR